MKMLHQNNAPERWRTENGDYRSTKPMQSLGIMAFDDKRSVALKRNIGFVR
ncbi:hypothetical protein [Nostoc sp. C052]|uniref:hypothetical protein n=1 Tax=Nostoc sp. C052 TaxID=2576902 RepID=UPI0015C40039|nr:hypothetical protein [Nostoc sp. C052]